MPVSEFGREIVEAFEGCKKAVPGRPLFTTYRDPVGVLTIGYGHTNLGNVPPRIYSGVVWTREQCDAALAADLAAAEAAVSRALSAAGVYGGAAAINGNQLDALTSFEFNTGDLAKSSIPAKLKAGDIDGAMATLLLYDHAGGKVLAGLARRRQCEVALFRGDLTKAAELADIHAASGEMMAKADRGTETVSK